MKNILFLDIDGVLNSDKWYRNPIRKLKIKLTKNYNLNINKWNLFWLSLFCKIKKLDIVLSSSWRYGWGANGEVREFRVLYVQNLFEKYGLNIIGRTCIGGAVLENNYAINPNPRMQSSDIPYYRGTQILDYIERHNLDIKDCLIIDDDIQDIGCYECLKPIIIETHYYKGLGGFQPYHLLKNL